MADLDSSGWQKRFERERQARKSAEKLLEDKSLEIWGINQALEKKVLERTSQLQEALFKAEAASRAKDTFLSSMSHELRTPLNAIIGFSQILIAKPDTNEGAKAFIEKIQIAGRTLLSLVNTILDFSKIEAGKMDYNPQRFTTESFCDEVMVILEPLIVKKNLEFLANHNGVKEMVGDSQLLKQVIINLCTNAIKFSPQNGTITIDFSLQESSLRIAVSDEGSGIEEGKKDELFQPFSQLSNAKTVEEAGTGLGLMIIKQVVKLHGGEVGVENLSPHGAQFWITIPQKRGSDD